MPSYIGGMLFSLKRARNIIPGDRLVAPRPTCLYVEVKSVTRQGRRVVLHCEGLENPGVSRTVTLDQLRQIDTWHPLLEPHSEVEPVARLPCPRCASVSRGATGSCVVCDLPGEIMDAFIARGWTGGPVNVNWKPLAEMRDTDTVEMLQQAQLEPVCLMPHWFLLTTENYLVAYAPGESWCPICRAPQAPKGTIA